MPAGIIRTMTGGGKRDSGIWQACFEDTSKDLLWTVANSEFGMKKGGGAAAARSG